MLINDPDTIAELRALYMVYENALVTNDVATLTAMFWSSPQSMRFGATENLYGIEEIASFRKGRSAANLARRIHRLDIVSFGKEYGSVTLEFERVVDGKLMRGRQSQVWVRMQSEWKIVAAHVSMLPDQ